MSLIEEPDLDRRRSDWVLDEWDEAGEVPAVEPLRQQTRIVKWVVWMAFVMVMMLIVVAGYVGWWYLGQVKPDGERGDDVAFTVLETDTLDLVLHHFLKTNEEIDEVASKSGADAAIRKMIDEKVVRFRGFSTHLPEVALAGMQKLDPDGIQLPLNATRVPDFEPEVLPAAKTRGTAVIAMKTCGKGYFFKAHATKPDRIDEYGPPPGALDRWDLPTPRDYIHYALSLPIATVVVGMDSYFTLDGVVSAAVEFGGPLSTQQMTSINERAQAFKTTGFWIPRG